VRIEPSESADSNTCSEVQTMFLDTSLAQPGNNRQEPRRPSMGPPPGPARSYAQVTTSQSCHPRWRHDAPHHEYHDIAGRRCPNPQTRTLPWSICASLHSDRRPDVLPAPEAIYRIFTSASCSSCPVNVGSRMGCWYYCRASRGGLYHRLSELHSAAGKLN